MRRTVHKCACSFAKMVEDRDPFNFPRIGIEDNILYRGNWIIKHRLSDNIAVIRDHKRGTLHAEADVCCFDWFQDRRLKEWGPE